MSPRRDPLTRREIVDYLQARVVTITYTPAGSTRKTGRFTLLHEYIKGLDNFPLGFETTLEAALCEKDCVNALDIDTNRWESIPVNMISRIEV